MNWLIEISKIEQRFSVIRISIRLVLDRQRKSNSSFALCIAFSALERIILQSSKVVLLLIYVLGKGKSFEILFFLVKRLSGINPLVTLSKLTPRHDYFSITSTVQMLTHEMFNRSYSGKPCCIRTQNAAGKIRKRDNISSFEIIQFGKKILDHFQNCWLQCVPNEAVGVPKKKNVTECEIWRESINDLAKFHIGTIGMCPSLDVRSLIMPISVNNQLRRWCNCQCLGT